jgi:hypothetical protein
MTFSHVKYLELARLIVSWQWVTEVPPEHTSPAHDNEPTIKTDSDLAEKQQQQAESRPARTAFVIWSLDDCLEGHKSAWAMENRTQHDSNALDELETSAGYRNAQNATPNLHIAIAEEFLKDWIKGYESDRSFGAIWNDVAHDSATGGPNHQFIKDERSLLYFIDPDYQPRLCIPSSLCNFVLREAHENPMESSHVGPERLWHQLSQKFYWKHMKTDVLAFARSCDICQKTKFPNFNKFGFLIPNPIPGRPYQSVSMDFIVNLPWSGEYNTIFVVVDRLTKHANFIPTMTGLTVEEFGALYIKHIRC